MIGHFECGTKNKLNHVALCYKVYVPINFRILSHEHTQTKDSSVEGFRSTINRVEGIKQSYHYCEYDPTHYPNTDFGCLL